MTKASNNGQARQAARRRLLEWAFWPVIILLGWGLDTLIQYQARQRTGYGLDDFRLWVEPLTSGLGVLLMVPLVVYWYRRFPPSTVRPVPIIAAHILGSMVFSLGHFCLLLLFRNILFALNNMVYHWRYGFFSNALFEYQKDIGLYLLILLILWSYTRYREAPARRAFNEGKMLVQTGRGESLLDFQQIDYFESARNYVTVFAESKEYLLRDTLSKLEQRLAPQNFARSHRSYLVNLQRVVEIVPREGGGHRIVLKGGAEVPLSRSYRETLRTKMEASK